MSAVLSADRRYRYELRRDWDMHINRPPLLWIMLNPSTADEQENDATIRRCIDFSTRWGYGSMLVGNLFAYRTRYPDELEALPIPERIGPDNTTTLLRLCRQADRIICAWGTRGIQKPGVLMGYETYCLGTTKDGYPKHPLYLPKDTPLERYGDTYAATVS